MAEQQQQDKKPKSRRGGARPGAGKKDGPRYQKRLRSFRERYPVFPLEHLMDVLNSDAPAEERFRAAVQAAPYVHPRLAAIQIQQLQEPQHSLDLTKLTDEELIFFERILAKAQITHPVTEADHQPRLIEHDPALPEIIDVTPEE